MKKIENARELSIGTKIVKIMDYEKKYKEAIERAKAKFSNEEVEDIFPELKESYDEKIRKWLIEMVEEIRKVNPTDADHNGMCTDAIFWLEKQGEKESSWGEEDERIRKSLIKYFSFNKDGGAHALDNITPKQIVAWLEKQREKKPTDKVEPKFHKGEWITIKE